MSVTVVSCLFGDSGFDRFIGTWSRSVAALEPAPDAVIVASDRLRKTSGKPPENLRETLPGAEVVVSDCECRHPQAWYQNQAIYAAETDWVWIVDMDDEALPDGLDGLDGVDADVWVLGYLRPDGEVYTPPQLTAAEYLAEPGNPFTGSSLIRTEAFRAAGGFPDVAFQDWALWRRMATLNMTFAASDRTHLLYNRHPGSRTAVELTAAARATHLAEMAESESLAVA